MFLITEEEIYEISGRTVPSEEAVGERLYVTIRGMETESESTIQVRFSGSLLASRDIAGFDKGDLAMRAACRAVRLREKPKIISVTTGNFTDLVGKKTPDDEIDMELARLIVLFFKKQPGIERSLTVGDLFVSTDFHFRDIQRRMQYLYSRGFIRPSTLERDRFEITRGGFRMVEALSDPVRQVPTPENRYFQLVSLSKKVKEPFAFVLMPLKEEEMEQKIYFEVIKPTVEKELNVMCIRADEETQPGVINNQVFTLINKAKLIIAETTTRNPNVFYELGMAHAFDKDVFVFSKKSEGKLPFDIANIRAVFYEDYEDLRMKIIENLKDHLLK